MKIALIISILVLIISIPFYPKWSYKYMTKKCNNCKYSLKYARDLKESRKFVIYCGDCRSYDKFERWLK